MKNMDSPLLSDNQRFVLSPLQEKKMYITELMSHLSRVDRFEGQDAVFSQVNRRVNQTIAASRAKEVDMKEKNRQKDQLRDNPGLWLDKMRPKPQMQEQRCVLKLRQTQKKVTPVN